MSAVGREDTVKARIEPFIAGMETGSDILSLAKTMGVPGQGYAYFILGIIYDESQRVYRDNFGLGVEQADVECLAFWQKNGTSIKDRLLKVKSNWLS